MKWLGYSIGAVVMVFALITLVLVLTANMMSDDPAQQTSYWYPGAAALFGAAIIIATAVA